MICHEVISFQLSSAEKGYLTAEIGYTWREGEVDRERWIGREKWRQREGDREGEGEGDRTRHNKYLEQRIKLNIHSVTPFPWHCLFT